MTANKFFQAHPHTAIASETRADHAVHFSPLPLRGAIAVVKPVHACGEAISLLSLYLQPRKATT